MCDFFHREKKKIIEILKYNTNNKSRFHTNRKSVSNRDLWEKKKIKKENILNFLGGFFFSVFSG